MIRVYVLIVLLFSAPLIANASYSPITGIPDIPWPTSLDIERPVLPDPWTSNIAGYWYIKNGGTNAGNGYPGNPRDSIIPGSLSPGDVVVIESGTGYTDTETFTVNGTDSQPIWVMSSDQANRITANGDWYFQGDYYIIDGIDFAEPTTRESSISFSGSYILARNYGCSNGHASTSGACIGATGSHLIFYAGEIGPTGNWQLTGETDIDQHGIKINKPGANIWIINNTFTQIMGDGVQVGDQNNTAAEVTNIYIGGNTATQMCQSGFWTKNATDVIFASNEISVINEDCPGGQGQAIGGQYDPVNVWFINNKIHNAASGVYISGASSGTGGPWYVIGNLIYSIESVESTTEACNAYNYGAIMYRNAGGVIITNNTVYDVDSFLVSVKQADQLTINNNIFSTAKTSVCPAINVQFYPETMDYDLFSTDAVKIGFDGGAGINDATIAYTSIAAFSAAQNKELNSPAPVDPMFIDEVNYNFALQASSRAISNAIVSNVYSTFETIYGVSIATDIAGTVRPQTSWDIGAYEFDEGTLVQAKGIVLIRSKNGKIAVVMIK